MKSAVLFLVFNRPDTTRKVFNAIRLAKPQKLYVSADGSRPNREGEYERCEEVRRIATAVDWPCELKTLFRDKNMGCKKGVSGGINWFFENEEEGIILEDDVLPVQSFFQYCDELLERYRHDERVGVISGCNLISKRFISQDSYFISRYNHVWGWASWRRAWQLYDGNMRSWPQWNNIGGLKTISDGNKLFEIYWQDIFEKSFHDEIDSWAYPWTFNCWYHGMMSVLPSHNQTNNIGCNSDATHTTGITPDFIKDSMPEELTFPLQHPEKIKRVVEADALIDNFVVGITKTYIIKQYIGRIPVLGGGAKYIWRILKKNIM